MPDYDIILAGAGLSGLTLAVELTQNHAFARKRILLLDRDAKTRNDRTWCFWATDDEPLPPVVAHSWSHCHFYSPRFAARLDIAPYRYRMVRGVDFYDWARRQLAGNPYLDWRQTGIERIDAAGGRVYTTDGVFSAPVIFNSALTRRNVLPTASTLYPEPPFSAPSGMLSPRSNDYTYILQHFRGWRIRSERPAFQPDEATLMDFRIPQAGETRFVYVLPFSQQEALVEFTVFSPALLAAADYEVALRDYIRDFLRIGSYQIEESEFGVIPMTDDPFGPSVEGRVVHIGTVGGFVKGSSGYAFKRTQRRIRSMVERWSQTPGNLPPADCLRSPWRNRWYDSILLRVLRDGGASGAEIFSNLFRKLPPALVLRFLDEDTTFGQELRVLNAPPWTPFIRAALQQAPHYFSI